MNEKQITLYACGDIFLQTPNGDNPFEYVKQIWEDKDILVGNLEAPVTDYNNCVFEKAVSLKTEKKNIKYLCEAKFDLVTLANNHLMDFGENGIVDTIGELNKCKIGYVGVESIHYNTANDKVISIKGIRVGFLNYYSYELTSKEWKIKGINEYDICKDIRSFKKTCDIVCVLLHWGVEHAIYPTTKQQRIARSIIDAGATLVIGHHPHILQGVEEYKNGLILYSLGNFNFNHVGLNKPVEDYLTKFSSIIKLKVSCSRILDYDFIPVVINHNAQPQIATNDIKKDILAYIDISSKPLYNNGISPIYWYVNCGSVYLKDSINSFIFRVHKYGVKHLFIMCKWLIKPFVISCIIGGLLGIIFEDKEIKRVKEILQRKAFNG